MTKTLYIEKYQSKDRYALDAIFGKRVSHLRLNCIFLFKYEALTPDKLKCKQTAKTIYRNTQNNILSAYKP